MNYLKDFGMFLYEQEPDLVKNGQLELNNIYFDSIYRFNENEFSLFTSKVLGNGIEYAISIDINREYLDDLISQITNIIPDFGNGLKEEINKSFNEVEAFSIQSFDIIIRAKITLKLKEGILKDFNGEEFIPFEPKVIQLEKVSENLWQKYPSET